MLSASSAEATPARDEPEPQEERREWGAESKEQALVVVIPTADGIGDKTRILSEQRQSSTDESYQCSAGTDPEPSTEQSSGNKHARVRVKSSIGRSSESQSRAPVEEVLLDGCREHPVILDMTVNVTFTHQSVSTV